MAQELLTHCHYRVNIICCLGHAASPLFDRDIFFLPTVVLILLCWILLRPIDFEIIRIGNFIYLRSILLVLGAGTTAAP